MSNHGLMARAWVEQARRNGALPDVVIIDGRRYLTWEVESDAGMPPVELRGEICTLLAAVDAY